MKMRLFEFPFIKNLTLLLIIFICGNPLANAQNELLPYLKTASDNNAGLKASFSEYRAALEMLPREKALPDPNIMFQYFTTPLMLEMGEQRFNISASQVFPWFGQLKAQEQAAAEMAKVKYESFISERNKLFFQVKNVYYKWYVQNKEVEITEDNLKLLQSMRELAKIGFEAGKGSLVDVLRADMEIAEMENDLIFLKENEIPLRAEFEKLLNQKINAEIIFPDTLWKDTIEVSKSMLLDSVMNNPKLKEMDYEISSWEKRMQAAKKMGYPAFSAGVTYMNMSPRKDIDSPGNGKDMYMFPEIGIMLPVNRKKYNSMVNEARYKSEAASFEKTEMKNELAAELEMTYRDYLNAQRKIELYSRLNALAGQARDLILSEFSTGGVGFEEVLRMQEQALVYALETEDARAMMNSSAAYINYLVGKD